MKRADDHRQRRHYRQRQIAVRRHQRTGQQERHACHPTQARADRKHQPGQAAQQPRRGQQREQPAARARPAHRRQQREHDHHRQVGRRESQMGDTVINRAKSRRDQMRFGARAAEAQQHDRGGDAAATCASRSVFHGRHLKARAEEEHSGHRHRRAGHTKDDPACRPAMDQTDANADAVEAARGHHEAHAVKQAALTGGQLRAVRVPVEDGENSNDDRRDPQGRAFLREHHRPEHQRGQSDADLDAGERNAEQSHHCAQRHHHRESDRQKPYRRSTELRTPQSDRDHRQHMIPARDRVMKAAHKAGRLPGLDVRPRARRRGERRQQHEPGNGLVRSRLHARDLGFIG